jgi:amidase
MLDPEAQPAITIDSGEELIVETWDAFEGLRDVAALEEKTLRGPATGPIYVNGAEPGDALRVEFLNISAKEGAVHMVRPGRGLLEEEFTEAYPTIMSFEEGSVVLPVIRLPLIPSMGLVADPDLPQNTASDSGPTAVTLT